MAARKPGKTIGRRKSGTKPAKARSSRSAAAPLSEIAAALVDEPDKEIPLVLDGQVVGYVISAARLSRLKAPNALVPRGPGRPERDVKIVSDIKEGLRRIKQELAEGVAAEWDDLNKR